MYLPCRLKDFFRVLLINQIIQWHLLECIVCLRLFCYIKTSNVYVKPVFEWIYVYKERWKPWKYTQVLICAIFHYSSVVVWKQCRLFSDPLLDCYLQKRNEKRFILLPFDAIYFNWTVLSSFSSHVGQPKEPKKKDIN